MENKEVFSDVIGKICVVRAYEAGVYYGTVEAIDGTALKITQVRNIWKWEGATCLSQLAEEGIKDGKVSLVVGSMVILNVCQIIPMTDKAINSLNGIEEWKIER